MAYFSNSSEGSALDELCEKCVHHGPVDGPGCQVLCLQLLWNYEQGTESPEANTKQTVLDMLIEQPGGTVKCNMFFPVEWLSDRGKCEIGKADKEAQDRVKMEEWNKVYGNRAARGASQ